MAKKNMGSVIAVLGLAAMAMSADGTSRNYNRLYEGPVESEEKRKRRLAKSEVRLNKARGMKQFFYGENSLWAINQKNADRKAKNKKWIE
ncbi:MAG: hypothetical protein E6Q68_06065 [Polynucleobacter sp.]|nr:MAG: hypothetical protein E6Q68_06065 [Polynucleobacter sp.]